MRNVQWGKGLAKYWFEFQVKIPMTRLRLPNVTPFRYSIPTVQPVQLEQLALGTYFFKEWKLIFRS